MVECKTHTPLRIMLPSNSMRCGKLSLGRAVVACEEVPLLQDEGRKEEVFLADNEVESLEESCLSKFSKFLGFPTKGLGKVIYDFMKEVSVRRKKRKGKGG